MNRSTQTCLSFSLLVSTLSLSPVLGQTVETYSQTYAAAPGYGTTVGDSWMAPVVVRRREITRANGDTDHIVEPLIMERHEMDIVPVGETTTAITTESGGRTVKRLDQSAISTQKVVQPRSTARSFGRNHLHRRTFTSSGLARTHYIARRVVTESSPRVIERTDRIEQTSAIVERKDPALLLY